MTAEISSGSLTRKEASMSVEAKSLVPSEKTLELSLERDMDTNEVTAFNVESMEGSRRIPVLSVRNPEHHDSIAEVINSGKPVAFEVGVIGIMIAIGDPRYSTEDSWKKFWEIKRGRLPQDKVPMMMHPKEHDSVVDYGKLHPDYHYLKDDVRAREAFYGKLPVHTILPVRDDVTHINREALVTTPEDTLSKPIDQQISANTVCLYFQNDEDWNSVIEKARALNPNLQYGITSFNDHGKPSPFNFSELIEYIQNRERVDFDFVVRDPVIEQADIRSSHTQVRIPLQGEGPEIIVVRKGPISATRISEVTGHPVRVLESAKLAARGHDEGKDLYTNVAHYILSAESHMRNRAENR